MCSIFELWLHWIGGLVALIALLMIFAGIFSGFRRQGGRSVGSASGWLRSPVLNLLFYVHGVDHGEHRRLAAVPHVDHAVLSGVVSALIRRAHLDERLLEAEFGAVWRSYCQLVPGRVPDSKRIKK